MQQSRTIRPQSPDAAVNASAPEGASTKVGAPPRAESLKKIQNLKLIIVYWKKEVGLVSEMLGQTLCYLADASPPAILVSQASRSLSLDELIEEVSSEGGVRRQDGKPYQPGSGERGKPALGNWEAAAAFVSKHLPKHRALIRR